ncbi:unnamed protein product [Gadus morhua 'NCC']
MFPMMMFSRVSCGLSGFLSSDFELSPDSLLSSSFLPGNGEKSRDRTSPSPLPPASHPTSPSPCQTLPQLPTSPSHPATLTASAFPSLPH